MRKNNLFKKTVVAGLVLLMTASLAACDGKKTDTKTEDKKTETKAGKEEDVELQVFIAASLNTAMTDIAERYEKEHPNVTVKIPFSTSNSISLEQVPFVLYTIILLSSCKYISKIKYLVKCLDTQQIIVQERVYFKRFLFDINYDFS